MAIKIGRAQQQTTDGWWCINLETSGGGLRRFFTISFQTEDEANSARDKILAATENALGATIAS
jgi:hypothetical protein